MYPNINKILKALANELTASVTEQVTQKLRETYVEDVTAIVKDCLNNNEIFRGSEVGFLTIDSICQKYKVSRKTVNNKCTLFEVERKQIGRHNLVNERAFVKAHDRPVEKPKFLSNQKAA